MQSKQGKFILFILGIVVLVGIIGFAASKVPAKPSKYTGLVDALKTNGVHMYGAFWCPHCAAQEAALEMTRPQLITAGIYNECSNADKSQTPICVEKKVESYPTWIFDKGITINSANTPLVCEPSPGKAGENAVCAQIASQYYKTWLFPDYKFSIHSATEPTHTANVWQFSNGSETTGELPIDFLASQSGYTLPK